MGPRYLLVEEDSISPVFFLITDTSFGHVTESGVVRRMTVLIIQSLQLVAALLDFKPD